MMSNNKVFLMGRATAPYQMKQYGNGTSYLDFSLAVENKMATKENNYPKAFFHNVRVSGKTAEYLANYGAGNGRLIVWGYLESGSYESGASGQKVYYTRIMAEEIAIIDYKKKENENTGNDPYAGFGSFPSGMDMRNPFEN